MAKTKRASASVVRRELTTARKGWGWQPSDIITLLRGGGSPGKGSDYERELCKRLSLWWTVGARDDVFWRCSGSGARAKVRGRQGADTAGQHGDVAATDPVGAPLIDVFTIEIKRGYSEYTFQDLIDRMAGGGVQEWEAWFRQAIESWEQAGSYSWMLITRRDRRQALVWVPPHTLRDLRGVGAFAGRPVPYVGMTFLAREKGGEPVVVEAAGMLLDDWLAGVGPTHVRTLAQEV